MSSTFERRLLMTSSLVCRGAACADETNRMHPFSMAYDKETASGRVTDSDRAELALRMAWVGKRGGKRVVENRERLFERHTVLSRIRHRLIEVPLELHAVGRCVRDARRIAIGPRPRALALRRASCRSGTPHRRAERRSSRPARGV